MPITLTGKGQVTIPKRIRDALKLLPGAPVEFSVNDRGDVLLHPLREPKSTRRATKDRFDAVRGRADVKWRTDELMKLLRADDSPIRARSRSEQFDRGLWPRPGLLKPFR